MSISTNQDSNTLEADASEPEAPTTPDEADSETPAEQPADSETPAEQPADSETPSEQPAVPEEAPAA